MKSFITLAVMVLSPLFVAAQGQNQPQQNNQGQNVHGQESSTLISIISQTESVGVDGSFNYSYETSNGIKVEQGGYLRKAAESRSSFDNNNSSDSENSGDVQVIQGRYSFTAPDGQQYSVSYIADENGFQPEGAHLPQAQAGLGGLGQQQAQNAQDQLQNVQQHNNNYQQQQRNTQQPQQLQQQNNDDGQPGQNSSPQPYQ